MFCARHGYFDGEVCLDCLDAVNPIADGKGLDGSPKPQQESPSLSPEAREALRLKLAVILAQYRIEHHGKDLDASTAVTSECIDRILAAVPGKARAAPSLSIWEINWLVTDAKGWPETVYLGRDGLGMMPYVLRQDVRTLPLTDRAPEPSDAGQEGRA